MRTFATLAVLALLTVPAYGEDDMARGMFDPGPSRGMFDPKPFVERGDEALRKTPPKPRARPNPYEWKPEWGPIWERGDPEWPEEMTAWFEEQHRLDMRDPEYRKQFETEVEKKRKELEDFKKRYEGWMREAQEALRPGVDI